MRGPQIALAVAAAAMLPAALPAQTSSVPMKPPVDSAAERQGLANFTACLARQRPSWARRTLAEPYLSQAQADIAARALSGTDSCVKGRNGMEVTFRTSTLVGSLAEHFLREALPAVGPAALARALTAVEPRNASEDYGLCVAARDLPAARALALSKPGSEQEAQGLARMGRVAGACFLPGEKTEVDAQALRSLIAIALYRAVTGPAR